MDVVTGRVRIITASQNAGALPDEARGWDLVCHSLDTHHAKTPTRAQMIATVIAIPYSAAISTKRKYGPAYRLWDPGQRAANPPGPTPRNQEFSSIRHPVAITA